MTDINLFNHNDNQNQHLIPFSLRTPESTFDHRDIPTEIWTTIFRACLSPTRIYSENHFVNPRVDNAPLVLARVCKKWRRVAVGDPRLWASFIMRCCATKKRDRVRHLELAKLWLGRSGTLPLSISLDSAGSVGMETHWAEETQELTRLFINLIPRWEHISIYLPLLDDFGLGLIPMRGAPLLRSIEIITLPKASAHGVPLRLDARLASCWRRSAHLRRFTFYGGSMAGNFVTTLHLPFTQITHLNIGNLLPTESAFAILETTADNLVCGKFGVFFQAWPPQENGQKRLVTMPKLLDLWIFLEWDIPGAMEDDAHLLNFITAPSLRELTIAQTEYWSQQPFEEFIERSGCGLRQLDILGVHMGVKDVLDCLLLNPELECFHGGDLVANIETQAVNRKLIRELGRFNKERAEFVLCPRLQELACDLGHVKVDRCKPFSKMVKCRMHPPAGRGYLKKVSVVDRCVGDPNHDQLCRSYIQPLRELEVMGLVVNYVAGATEHWVFKY